MKINLKHLKIPNKLLTESEFLDNVTKAFADTNDIYDYASDERFERMKKYMTQDKIDKADYLREIIRSNQEYFLIKYK